VLHHREVSASEDQPDLDGLLDGLLGPEPDRAIADVVVPRERRIERNFGSGLV
jgi:hypothetical protein